MTREQLARMLDLAAAGKGAAEIGRQIGASLDNVRSACRARGIRLVRGKRTRRRTIAANGLRIDAWSPEEEQRLGQMYAERRTDCEIGRALRRAATSVRLHRRMLGLHRQPGTVL